MSVQKDNKKLVSIYPFLAPRNMDGSVVDGYDYSYTEADSIPVGWSGLCDAFFNDLSVAIESEHIDNFGIEYFSAKDGSLKTRYYPPRNERVDKVLKEYRNKSKYVCMHCGAEATMRVEVCEDYTLVLCNDCLGSFIASPDKKILESRCIPIFTKEDESDGEF